MKRGYTVMELLVVLLMMAFLIAGAVRAFSVAVDFQTRVIPEREINLAHRQFERDLRQLVSQAMLNADSDTFFVLGVPGGGQGTLNSENLEETMTFTVQGGPPTGASLDSIDDFETLHSELGPQGGIQEISLSTTPFGQPTNNQTGLFIREQFPSDADATQGGFERLLNAEVATIGFEAYDGLQWTSTWDTTLEEEPRLPAAIRITYTLVGDEETQHVVVVRLALSDVTVENPAGTGGTLP